jgi:hypothetical protein
MGFSSKEIKAKFPQIDKEWDEKQRENFFKFNIFNDQFNSNFAYKLKQATKGIPQKLNKVESAMINDIASIIKPKVDFMNDYDIAFESEIFEETDKINKQNMEQEKEIRNHSEQLDKFKKQNIKQERKMRNHSEQLDNFKEQNKEQEKEIRNHSEQLDKFKGQNKEQEKEIRDYYEQLDKFKKQNIKQEKKIQDHSEQLDNFKGQNNEQEKEIRDHSEQLDNIKGRNMKQEKEIRNHSEQLDKFKVQNNEQENERRNNSEQLDKIKSMINDLKEMFTVERNKGKSAEGAFIQREGTSSYSTASTSKVDANNNVQVDVVIDEEANYNTEKVKNYNKSIESRRPNTGRMLLIGSILIIVLLFSFAYKKDDLQIPTSAAIQETETNAVKDEADKIGKILLEKEMGRTFTVEAKVDNFYFNPNNKIKYLKLSDDSGTIDAVIFSDTELMYLEEGNTYIFTGETDEYKGKIEIVLSGAQNK